MSFIFERLLNTTEGMTVIRNNVKNDDSTDLVQGVDWFRYSMSVVSNVYVNGNNWIGFTGAYETLKICRRDGAIYYIYRQEGELITGEKFLKLRVEGYTLYSSKEDQYKLIYELFLVSNGCIFINILHTPSNTSYMGVSSITNLSGTADKTINIPAGVTEDAPLEVLIRNAGTSSDVITYERYPSIAPVGIEVTTLPNKTEYYGNELFDSSGLTVSYLDGTGNKCLAEEYTLEGYDSSLPGTKTVTVTKDGFTAAFEVTIREIEIIGIEVTALPNKKIYELKENLDTSGMIISFVLSDGNKEAASIYQLSELDSESIGDKDITVTYADFTTTFTVTIDKYVTWNIGYPNPEDVVATLDYSTGLMRVSGTGATQDYKNWSYSPFIEFADKVFNLIVESGITKIGYCFFASSYGKLETITFPETLVEIEAYAFCSESKLHEVNFPEGLKRIGCYAFDSDPIASIQLPESLTDLEEGAFEYNEVLTSVVLPEGLKKVDICIFCGCDALENVVLPEGIESIEWSAFGYCNSLRTINIPSSLKNIDAGFEFCGLKMLELPETVMSLTNRAFRGCPELELTVKNTECEIEDNSDTLEVKLLKGHIGSTTESYAVKYSVPFEPLETVAGIEITTLPDKIEYLPGEEFDSTGLKMSAILSDGTKKQVSAYEITGFNSTAPGTKTITVSYQGYEASFNVVVKQVFTVTFKSWDGSTLKQETVVKGNAAEAPEPPARAGYTFTGWDKAFSNVQADLIVTAQYRINVYIVTFLDKNGNAVKTQNVEHGSSAAAPEPPAAGGYEFTGWDTDFSVVTSNLTVKAQYRMIPAIGIRIASYPDKVYYRIGDELDTTGLQVAAITNDGTERAVTGYTFGGFDSGSVGRKEITVMYSEEVSDTLTKTYTADFTVKVTETGDNPFDEDSVSVSITIHWPNGEFRDLTNEDIISQSVTLKESICSERYFIFGGCESNQISFTAYSEEFIKEDAAIDDTKIEVSVECKGTVVKLFTGRIASSKRSRGLLKREIVAYDELYFKRNINIAWWYKNHTTDKQMLLTQKQFRDLLFEHLGIEQVQTELEYDSALVPDNNIGNDMNPVSILKDLCLQNSVFGWMNREGKFEYLKLPENARLDRETLGGKKIYEYFPAAIYFDTYKSCEFNEGRIWYPKEFLTDPYPGVFAPGDLTAQEAYEQNVYYNRNSFFVGNADWLDRAFEGDEYGIYTRMEPVMPICFGTTTKWDNQHLYMARGYKLQPNHGNPLNRVGDTIEITVRKVAEDGTELTWVINSYIMSRILKITCDSGTSDEYSANNAPYNGNNTETGRKTQELSAKLFRMRSEGPTISYADFTDGTSPFALEDAGEAKKARLRCLKRCKKADYDVMVAAGTARPDTLYLTYEE